MTEVLSQKELDQLINAINSHEEYEEKEDRSNIDIRKIKIYDFKRPDKFSRDQIRAISMMHEAFARLCTNTLSTLCQAMVHIHVASVDQLTYEEFVRSMPTPTCLSIINMDPLHGNAVLEIDPTITFSILELLLGGEGNGDINQHEITDIEQSIMEGVIVRLLGNLRESWTNILDLRPRLGQIETNPQFCQIVPPNDMVVLITFEAKVGDVEGMINICFPYLTIESIVDKLNTYKWYCNHSEGEGLRPDLSKVNVTLKAELFRKEMNISQLKALQNGTTIWGDGNLNRLVINNTVIGTFEKENNNIKITNINHYLEKNYMEEKNNVNFVTSDLDQIKVQIICELGRAQYTLFDVNNMAEGTILTLDKIAGEPVDVFANNVKIAKGEVVVIDENFGVRICETIKKDDNQN